MAEYPTAKHRTALWTVALAAAASLSSGLTYGGEIMTHKGVQIGLPDGQGCGPTMNVELQAESLDTFHRSRIDMQEVARLSRAYVSLDCPELKALRFEGSADGKVVYRAQSARASDWTLDEASEVQAGSQTAQAPAAAEPPSTTPGATRAGPASRTPDDDSAPAAAGYASARALQQKAEAGDAAAQLDVARAQLGLEDAPAGIELPADVSAGIAKLEALAKTGNADAMHALAEAYLKHPDVPVNEALVAELTRVTPTAGQRLRGMAAALLTLKAAEQGSPGAVGAMNEAGQTGSPSSYYALGTMYMLDRRGRMPRSKRFLRKRLKIRRGLSGGGNVDVGLHFMRLAASAGHAAAAAMLQDLGESLDSGAAPASASGSASSTSAATAAASAGQAPAGVTAANLQAVAQGVLSASVFSQVLEPASGPESVAGTHGAAAGTGAQPGSGAQGAGSAGSNPAVVQRSRRATTRQGSPGRTRRPHPDTIMESESGEAEIVD